MPKTIATVDEYDAATQRISELENFAEGTPQADELGELVAAVMEWDKTHDDATVWKE
jgi:hypothetical protein